MKDSPEAWKSQYDFNVIHGDKPGEKIDQGASCKDPQRDTRKNSFLEHLKSVQS